MESLSEEARYRTFNFYPPCYQERICEVFRSGQSRVIVLADDAQGGAFCLAAAAFEAGRDVEIITVDPSEREQDTSLTALLRREVRKNRLDGKLAASLLEGVEAELKGEMKSPLPLKLGMPGLVSVSIALKKKLPLTGLFSIGTSESTDDRPAREALSLLLEEATRNSRIVLHVTDALLLSADERWWIIEESKRNARLFVALSCDMTSDEELIPVERSEWLQFEALSKKELRSVLDDRCSPNDFDDRLVDALWKYSEGHPALVARKMVDLVQAGCLDWDERGWRTDGSVQELSQVFHATLYEPIAQLAPKLPRREHRNLERFLQLASLCGDAIPVTWLIRFMELDAESVEALTRSIGAHLLGGDEPVLLNLEHEHDSFRDDSLVHQFTNPLIVGEIHRRIPEGPEDLALCLLSFMRDNVHFDTKGKARVGLAMARFAQDRPEWERLRLDLDWWFVEDQAEEFEDALIEMIRSGLVDPEVVWKAADVTADRWPSRRRLALLHAYETSPEGMPDYRLMEFLELKGKLLLDLGSSVDSESLFREALDLRRNAYGPEHPGTLRLTNEVAAALVDQGRYEDAETLFLVVLESRRRVLGPKHPDTLISMSNLAATWDHQGRFAEAESLERETLDLRRRVFGRDDPRTLPSLHNLALILEGQGRHAEAGALSRESLDLHRRVLGPEHPDTLKSMVNLAGVIASEGELAVSESLSREALGLSRGVLGPLHPITLGALNCLAVVLFTQKRFIEAEPLFREALDLHRQVLGAEHPAALISITNLGAVLGGLAQYAEAERLCREGLDFHRIVVGPEHPSTLTAMMHLASVLQPQGRHEEAMLLYREVLDVRRRVLGPEHPDTLASVRHLAKATSSQAATDERKAIGGPAREAENHAAQ